MSGYTKVGLAFLAFLLLVILVFKLGFGTFGLVLLGFGGVAFVVVAVIGLGRSIIEFLISIINIFRKK